MTTDAQPKPMNKTQLKQMIAESAGITSKQADAVLDAFIATAIDQTNTVGSFAIPGLLKIVKVVKPATPEKEMMSPFTKEMITVKAKPARNVVKIRPLKSLKDSVS